MQKASAVLPRLFFYEIADEDFRPRWRLIGLMFVLFALAVLCFWLWLDYLQPPAGGAHEGKIMVFKCLNCQQVKHYTLKQVSERTGSAHMAPGIVLHCEECGQNKLTQATKCPQCEEVFVISMGRPGSDKCPNCGASYLDELRRKLAQDAQE